MEVKDEKQEESKEVPDGSQEPIESRGVSGDHAIIAFLLRGLLLPIIDGEA
jgi:hypothetical protein